MKNQIKIICKNGGALRMKLDWTCLLISRQMWKKPSTMDLNKGEGGGGQKVSYSVMHGGGGWGNLFPMYSWGAGAIFWGATNFDKPPPPVVNYEHSLRKQKEYIQWMHDAHIDTQCPNCTLCHHKADLSDHNLFHDQDHLHLFPLLVLLLLSEPGKGENRSVRSYWFILGLLSFWFRICWLGVPKAALVCSLKMCNAMIDSVIMQHKVIFAMWQLAQVNFWPHCQCLLFPIHLSQQLSSHSTNVFLLGLSIHYTSE